MDALREFWDFITTADRWTTSGGILDRIGEHLWISFLAVVLAAFVALPVALVLGHVRRGGLVAASIVNIGRALPTLAVISLLFPISLTLGFTEHLGFWPTAVALVLLAIPPMFTNAYAGVRDVDPAIVEAARGMGMQPRQVLWRVETPTALPLILAGVRVSAVHVVATATLGAWVGFGGLGAFLYRGLAQNDDGLLLMGAVMVAILALAAELGFGVVERALTPWVRERKSL